MASEYKLKYTGEEMVMNLIQELSTYLIVPTPVSMKIIPVFLGKAKRFNHPLCIYLLMTRLF
jgi:hypothetical protein